MLGWCRQRHLLTPFQFVGLNREGLKAGWLHHQFRWSPSSCLPLWFKEYRTSRKISFNKRVWKTLLHSLLIPEIALPRWVSCQCCLLESSSIQFWQLVVIDCSLRQGVRERKVFLSAISECEKVGPHLSYGVLYKTRGIAPPDVWHGKNTN